MEQEQNEGIAYLMALKQSRSAQGSADAPGPENCPEADSGLTPAGHDDRFQGAEKRRTPRYKCEGSAEMRAEGSDVRTWATFTDVSLHGCYVEAQATYPAGSILHMKLDANDIRVETQGTVRVNYPYLGMGIAFKDMSDESQTRLKQLLATISRPSVIMGPGIASSLPATEPLAAVPLISNPHAAVQALVEFFESRQMLMREDFLRILRKSQSPELRP
jgi:hypothetical protein